MPLRHDCSNSDYGRSWSAHVGVWATTRDTEDGFAKNNGCVQKVLFFEMKDGNKEVTSAQLLDSYFYVTPWYFRF